MIRYESTIKFIHYSNSDEGATSRVDVALQLLGDGGFDVSSFRTEKIELASTEKRRTIL